MLAERDSAPIDPALEAFAFDADNQSPGCVAALADLLRDEFAVDRIDAFQEHTTEIQARPLTVPIAPDAADVALIMELGANLDHHIGQRTIVVVVSRDRLLIQAAEQAKDRGARVFLTYVDGEAPTARNSRLTTLLLPVVNPLAKAPPAFPAQPRPLRYRAPVRTSATSFFT